MLSLYCLRASSICFLINGFLFLFSLNYLVFKLELKLFLSKLMLKMYCSINHQNFREQNCLYSELIVVSDVIFTLSESMINLFKDRFFLFFQFPFICSSEV